LDTLLNILNITYLFVHNLLAALVHKYIALLHLYNCSMLNEQNNEFTKGRGAQYNPKNKFTEESYIREFSEGIDDWEQTTVKTTYTPQPCNSILNAVTSVDVPMDWSVNPYQGCEHGCIYCYARPTHEYLGYSAGLDFESKIIVKENAAAKLTEAFQKLSWKPTPISLSGNTDPYQPAERKYKITRELLKVCSSFKNPVGLITKNALILRDLDLLKELAEQNLVQVFTSLTATDEKLRLKLEPRTSTYADRLKIIEILSKNNIPVGIMNAPIIPGINDTQMHDVLKLSADAGAKWAGYTIVRLNGAVEHLFTDWLHKTFADRADKVLNLIKDAHGGSLNDSRPGVRMKGEGNIANIINAQFKLYVKKYGFNTDQIQLNTSAFIRQKPGGQLSLFD
jgi:DNA repair photolyase